MHILTRVLFRNGVVVTAGTDANGACGVILGFSLRDELESLSKVGLTNAQVLQAATVASAKWMQGNTGKIEAEYKADLVLLKENLLEGIRNTRAIHAVIANGKYLDRALIDEILKSIKEANNKSRKINIDGFIN
ncbi:MAG: imidazolonepropionase-like amidohydrolase [Flavobacteriales bacterium]|jgi:imidazolonepropionase-like amidohydrolase